MTTKTLSNYITAAVLLLIAALAVANRYVRPSHATVWGTAVIFAAAVLLALVASRRLHNDGGKTEASIQGGVVAAGLLLVMALTAKLATAFGLNNQTDVAWRATMATIGAFLMVRGNAMPKKVTPLSRITGDATVLSDAIRIQTMRRFAGWMWVLTGLALMVPWLLLSIALANTVTFILLPGAILVTLIQCLWLRGAQGSAA